MPTPTSFEPCYPPVNRAVMDTGCYVTSVGLLNHERGLAYPPAGHPRDFRFDWEKGRTLADATLLGISSGSGFWETRHEKGRLEAGSVLFLPPGEWHRYRPNLDTGWCEQWLCLRGDLLHRTIEKYIIPARARVRKCDKGPAWEARLKRLREEIMAHPGSNLPSWGVRALSIVLELWEPVDAPTIPTHAAGSTMADLTRQALGFIEQNSHRPIFVEDVARACGRNRRTLERLFHDARLGSVAETIIAQRLSRAKYLLRETPLSIKQVAGEAGFGSSQHLIACFRRLENCTPSEYRGDAHA